VTLTPAQLAAVTTAANRVLVTGTAGAGKSLVLAKRVRWLLDEGAEPTGICAVCFTNAASSELAERLGADAEKLGFVGTLHSLCFRIQGRPLIVLDDELAREVLDEVIAALRYRGSLKDVRGQLSAGPLASRGGSQAALVATEYYRLMADSGLSDYDSLLHLGLEAARTKGQPIQHLLVDEAADATPLDWQIYEALAPANWYVSADVEQSIMSWRGASLGRIELMAAGGWGEVHRLPDAFRCSAAIANAARAVLSGQRLSTVAAPPEVSWRGYNGELEEMQAIVGEVLSAQLACEEVAVLTRTNALADRFREALRTASVAVAQAGQTPSDWRKAMDIVELCANPSNDYFAWRVLRHQLGQPEADRLKLLALQNFTTLNSAYFHLPANGTAREVVELLANSGVSDESQVLVQQTVLANPGLRTAAELAVAIAGQDVVPKREGVVVTTVHRAKGLEFDTVFLPAWEEGIFPSPRSDIAEERRVAFVALTRARRCVRVSWAGSRTPPWKRAPEPSKPSQFI
jgi:DNA helicase II / ATP-dependent DNA helicase PcrA